MNNNKINHLNDNNKKSEYIVIDFTYNELINNCNEKNTIEIYKIFIGLVVYNVIIILFQIIKLKTAFKPIYLVPFLITLGFKIYDAFIYSSDVYSSSRLKLSYLISFLPSFIITLSEFNFTFTVYVMSVTLFLSICSVLLLFVRNVFYYVSICTIINAILPNTFIIIIIKELLMLYLIMTKRIIELKVKGKIHEFFFYEISNILLIIPYLLSLYRKRIQSRIKYVLDK